MLEDLRAEICRLNQALPRHGLVAWTSGNVSGRDRSSGLVVIKPSGVPYDELTPQTMAVVDLDGSVVAGTLTPSSDTAAHCYIYRHRADVGGVVHTHSTYATAFAATDQAIPAVLTATCDEFGGPIPCVDYAPVGDESIGRVVLDALDISPAVLVANHGVFTVGISAIAALKAAVMCEDVARTTFAALQLGRPRPIPDAEVARAHRRYQEAYGQR